MGRRLAGLTLALALALVACREETPEPEYAAVPVPADEQKPIEELPVKTEPTPDPDAEPAPAPTPIADAHRDAANRIIEAATTQSKAWERLTYLCDVIGPRLSGSKGLENAVEWTAATMEADGFDEVRKEPVTVKAWVRGNESATMLAPREMKLHMLGLGNSVGTPKGGVTGDVVIVYDFDELEELGDAVKDKIVLYYNAMPTYDPRRGSGYGQAVRYRTAGPSRAAKYGALAVILRSVTAKSLQTPHTGMLRYEKDMPKIPAAAITIEDAELITRLVDGGHTVRVHLEMEAHFAPDAQSANVVGELRGREKPDEVIVVGGHLDSWDVGQGAHDDGGPCMAAMEAIRLLKELDLRPRRTIRVVLWTNEENGLGGAREYVRAHEAEMPNHVAAIEADSGAFKPMGFRNPPPKPDDERGHRVRAQLEDIATLLEPIDASSISNGGGGADIGPMAKFGVPLLGLHVEGSKYFDYHHTHADTLDKVDKKELDLCVATLAVMCYTLAEMPTRLGE